jgi:6-phosphogluconolactonase
LPVTRRDIILCDDLAELSQRAAQQFAQLANPAIEQRGRFDVALSGGSTPRALYALLASAPLSAQITWSRVHLFWGDERCVAPDHPDSNYRMTRESLLERIAIPETNIHRLRGEDDPEAAARAYEAELRRHFGSVAWPRFDLVLLGLGDDGHTASLFPHSAALLETQRWVTATYIETFSSHRLTLTYPVLNNAAQVSFLVGGASKAAAVRAILQSGNDDLPAARVHPSDGTVTWILDRDAAGRLT